MTARQIADLMARDPRAARVVEDALAGVRARRNGTTITASR